MARTIHIAAVQMDAAPSPVDARLKRVERLISEAAETGAQLVVLPELFNTGYVYSDENYRQAEPLTGRTVSWMKTTAASLGIHLAGTLLLLDVDVIYNALILVAPDGRLWRYNKNYPWFWERAYFHEGYGITIADTDLGRLGLMICWDAMHPELWDRYAGRVDAMVVCSCPPKPHNIEIVFPDEQRLAVAESGPLLEFASRGADDTFGPLLRRQAAFLGIPVVNTTGTGIFRSQVPMPYFSLAIYLAARPDLLPMLAQASSVQIEAPIFNETYVANASGDVLAHVPAGEGFALAEVSLSDSPPVPTAHRPRFGLSLLAYLLFDWIGNPLMVLAYRRGTRRVLGRRMAPLSMRMRLSIGILAVVGLVGYLLGRRHCRR